MKSKVRIGLSEDRRPCIIIEKEYTDDVRDDLVCRFVEDLGYDSIYFKLIEVGTQPGTYKIVPVNNLDDHLVDVINQIIKTRQFIEDAPYLKHLESLLEFLSSFGKVGPYYQLDVNDTTLKVGMTASVPVTYTDGIQPPSTDAIKLNLYDVCKKGDYVCLESTDENSPLLPGSIAVVVDKGYDKVMKKDYILLDYVKPVYKPNSKKLSNLPVYSYKFYQYRLATHEEINNL